MFKNVESLEPNRSSEISSVQNFGVPVLFFTITVVHGYIIEKLKGTGGTQAC